jgi:hypothetical protein
LDVLSLHRTVAGVLAALMICSSGAPLLAESDASIRRGRRLRAPRNVKMSAAVRAFDTGRLEITRGTHTVALNLRPDIGGCVGRLYDPVEHEKYGRVGITFDLVDGIERGPDTYLILLASIWPNCNVQGRCGAPGGEDSSLIWLKLNGDLTLAAKQVFALDDCESARSAQLTGTGPEGLLTANDLHWNGELLQVDYQMIGCSSDCDWRLIYDRSNPDAGIKQVHVTKSNRSE